MKYTLVANATTAPFRLGIPSVLNVDTRFALSALSIKCAGDTGATM